MCVAMPLLYLLLAAGSLLAGAAEESCAESNWRPWDDDDTDVNLSPILLADERPAGECEDLLKEFQLGGSLTVQKAVETIPSRREHEEVLIMLNGANDGFLVPYLPGCHLTMVSDVLRDVHHVEPLSTPMYLYTNTGRPVRNSAEEGGADIDRSDLMVHVLLEGERWMWPGIEIGFSWTLGHVKMTTLSLMPRVFLVDNLMDDDAMETIIKLGQPNLFKSEEKHYNDDPRFRNYRTSSSGWLDHNEDTVKKLRFDAHQIARLPDVSHVESPMFLQYTPGTWYKQHEDTYHNYNRLAKESETHMLETFTRKILAAWDQLAASYEQYAEFVEWCKTSPEFTLSLKNRVTHSLQLRFSEVLAYHPSMRGSDMAKWLLENVERQARNLLVAYCDTDEQCPTNMYRTYVETAMREFEASVGSPLPASTRLDLMRLQPRTSVRPNRHVTLLPYLNDVEEGGETVFPEAAVRSANAPKRDGMPECSKGLVVPPVKGSAALFYHVTPQGVREPRSTHGGCPPVKGIKNAINVFMWNCDFLQGIQYYQ